jgi:AraC family transcriptional regulator
LSGLPPSSDRPQINHFEAKVLSRGRIDGDGFRFESQSQDVKGHCNFDAQYREHLLTLTPDGPATRVVACFDGGPLQPFSVGPGQLTLLPIGARIRGYLEGLGTRGELQLFFQPELLTRASGADIDPSKLGLIGSMDLRNSSVLQAMAALGREVEQPGCPMGRVYSESLVVVTLTELVRRHSTLSMAPKSSEALHWRPLRRIIDYIEAHLGKQLSLLTLAGEAGMSAAHLSRGFRRAMGKSVHQYLLGQRVEWAAGLLVTTDLLIAEIALETGFSSQAHLTTAFQRQFRTTPALYRRESR